VPEPRDEEEDAARFVVLRYDEYCEDWEESTCIKNDRSMPKEEQCTVSASTVSHPEASV